MARVMTDIAKILCSAAQHDQRQRPDDLAVHSSVVVLVLHRTYSL